MATYRKDQIFQGKHNPAARIKILSTAHWTESGRMYAVERWWEKENVSRYISVIDEKEITGHWTEHKPFVPGYYRKVSGFGQHNADIKWFDSETLMTPGYTWQRVDVKELPNEPKYKPTTSPLADALDGLPPYTHTLATNPYLSGYYNPRPW